MIVQKELASPNTSTWYTDEQTGLPKRLDVTPELIAYWHQSGLEMLAAGLSIPVPLEHQPDAKPMTAAERAASQLKNNTGWVKDFSIANGKLYSNLDIEDAEVAKKLPTTIKWTSPYFNSFIDPTSGKERHGVITHIALTSRPRFTQQQPFPTIAAAMNYIGNVAPANPKSIKGSFSLSRAGRLTKTGNTFKPSFPLAFSLWSGGIALASDEMFDKKPPADDKPKPDAGIDPLLTPDEPESKVDSAGDISIYEVLADLLAADGTELMGHVTEDSFNDLLYKALMEKIKNKSAGADMTGDPMKPPPPPANPVMQESAPMMMSLEKIKTITDPDTRAMAEMAFSLQQNAFNVAKERREKRIEALVKKRKDESFKAKLLGLASGAAFSLGTDGVVKDSMGEFLDALEMGVVNLPSMLEKNGQSPIEEEQPKDSASNLSPERRSEIVNRLVKQAGGKVK